MERKELKELLIELQKDYDFYKRHNVVLASVFAKAHNAVERLIRREEDAEPKKPLEIHSTNIKLTDEDDTCDVVCGICPKCKGELKPVFQNKPNRVFAHQNFCSDCGQALDWSGVR